MEQIDEIKNIVNEFFKQTKIANFEIKNIENVAGDSLNISVFLEDSNLLANDGELNIRAFEAVLRLLIKKQLKTISTVHLDINNYRESKNEALRELAKKAARRARFYKTPVTLEAMSSYDRRIIHVELSGHPDIKTESVGDSGNRKVVIKYINL